MLPIFYLMESIQLYFASSFKATSDLSATALAL